MGLEYWAGSRACIIYAFLLALLLPSARRGRCLYYWYLYMRALCIRL
jgi:hypothetical protein